jgi:aldose 1-epimerase
MKSAFGKNKDGHQVSLYTVENDSLIMKVMDYGATLVSLIDKKTGIDVTAGFDCAEDYMKQSSYIGASIGRTANRIARGIFQLDGKEYHLFVNNSSNCNHGGRDGFDKKMYEAAEEGNSVVFHRVSPDMEEGYPGNLDLTITYTLLENGVSLKTSADSDKDTLFAYTNHSYFNLDGSDDSMGHQVKINANQYRLSDANGLTLDEARDVTDTPFDFTDFKTLGRDIDTDNQQLKFANGYDHNFIIKGTGMRKMAVCRGKKLELTVMSDYPCMHLYTGNWLDDIRGKNGMYIHPRSHTAFEAEYCPNAVNYSDIKDQPIVHKGEIQDHEIRYLLKNL